MRSAPPRRPRGESSFAGKPGGCEQASGVGSAAGSRAGLPTCRARCPPVALPLCRAVPGRRAAAPRLGRHALRWHGSAGGHTISMGLTLSRRGSLAGPPRP